MSDEGTILHWVRQIAPGVGIGLLAFGLVGWQLAWWEEPRRGGADLPSQPLSIHGSGEPAVPSGPALIGFRVVTEPQAAAESEGLMTEPTVGAEATSARAASPALDEAVLNAESTIISVTTGAVMDANAYLFYLSLPPPGGRSAPEPEPVVAARPLPTILPAVPTEAARPRSAVASYVVAPGDTLSGIAARHGVSLDTLRVANDLGPGGLVRSGQTLYVPTVAGPVHVVAPGETLSGIAASYRVDSRAVAAGNGLSGSLIVPGQRLVIPGGTRPAPPAAPQPTARPARAPRQAAPTATPKPTPRSKPPVVARTEPKPR